MTDNKKVTPLTISALIVAAMLALPAVALAAKGGNGGGGGKPGGGGGEDPPADPAIAYMKGDDMMVMNADGSNQTRVLRNVPGYGPEPSWSPDPANPQFVYNATHDGAGIYTVDLDGGNITKIATTESAYVSGPDWGPAAAPDGNTWIAFNDSIPSDANRDIFLVSPDGQYRIQLTDTPDVSETYPTWSNDGGAVAVVAGHMNEDQTAWVQDVWIYELEFVDGQLRAKAPISLTDQPGNPLEITQTLAFTDWAKTQDKIVVSTILPNDPDEDFDLWEIDFTDLSNISYTNLTAGAGGGYYRQASWSTDDSEIAYWRTGTGGQGVFIMNADGTNHRQMVKRDAKAPDWKH